MDNLNYGVVGNGLTGALVSSKGSIDWLCLPQFNSASVFASILDEEKGGAFGFIVSETCSVEQSYIPNTNLLVTRYQDEADCFEVIDFMPRYHENHTQYYTPADLIRYIRRVSGEPRFKVRYDPKLEYGMHPTKTRINSDYIKSFTTKGPYSSMYLYTSFDFKKVMKGEAIQLTGDGFFLISYNQQLFTPTLENVGLDLERTKVYWLNWAARTRRFKRFNDEILRSALVLKLLSYQKSGAILAALTTSLPETIGEDRNWDYRFCWLRDASMAMKVLMQLGHRTAAQRFMTFILNLMPEKDENIQIMYGIHGEKKLTEITLDHLDGYGGSKPVRIGNAAYRQKQNDIYGVLMDVIYLQFKQFRVSLENSEDLWTITRGILRQVKNNWAKPDRGIWELRTSKQHFTFSKVLCWVAFDRGVRIAEMIDKQDYVKQWSRIRDQIREDILQNAWDEGIGAFTQYYGSNELDASNLLMERYGFIEASDPRYVSTVLKTRDLLSYEGLMYRYRNRDDFGIPKSSFTICTFWLITALYRIGEKAEAERLFKQILSYSNHLGLFSEDIDFKTKRLLGNFPQAYSHLALIETAITLADEELTVDETIRQALR